MKNWQHIASDDAITKTVDALTENGCNPIVVSTKKEAKEKVLSLIPKGSEVMTMTSITLDQTEIAPAINASHDYHATRDKLYTMDRKTQNLEMQKMGAAPEYVIGSVHAITQGGTIVVASNTGSQLAAYVYGASHVIFVIGAQKIVKNFDEALERINTYVLEKESERARKAYGVEGSNVNKLLVINKEVNPSRITVVIVKEELGF